MFLLAETHYATSVLVLIPRLPYRSVIALGMPYFPADFFANRSDELLVH